MDTVARARGAAEKRWRKGEMQELKAIAKEGAEMIQTLAESGMLSERVGCVRHPHKREEGCKWCEV